MLKENGSGVIYQILCSRCPQTYIGRTGRTLRQGLKEYQRAVRDRNTSTSSLADHICSTGLTQLRNKTQILDSCPHTSKQCQLESWMIQKQPTNLNRELGPLPPVYFSDLHTHPILCMYFVLFSCTLLLYFSHVNYCFLVLIIIHILPHIILLFIHHHTSPMSSPPVTPFTL